MMGYLYQALSLYSYDSVLTVGQVRLRSLPTARRWLASAGP